MDKKNEKMIDEFNYLGNAASAQECTGLIPSGECSEEDLERYKELYQFGAPTVNRRQKDNNSNLETEETKIEK